MEIKNETESASRVEVIEEIFFPTRGVREEGTIIPAPPAALAQRDKWKEEWLTKHPRTRTPAGLVLEEPRVSMGPAKREGRYGSSVRKEIIYPHER